MGYRLSINKCLRGIGERLGDIALIAERTTLTLEDSHDG